MDFETAYKTLVRRSAEQNTKELPAILKSLDFGGLDCLEIGCGPLARLAIKLSGFAGHITCLESDSGNVKEAKRLIEQQGLEKKITVSHHEPTSLYTLPYENNSFDCVYGAWIPHKLATDPRFLDEVSRVSKKHILFLMPGVEGDEPTLVSFVRPGEKQRRQEYQAALRCNLKKKGYSVSVGNEILRLNFKSPQEIQEVFYCLAFKNENLGDKRQAVDSFLESRTHNFNDGFYTLHAMKG